MELNRKLYIYIFIIQPTPAPSLHISAEDLGFLYPDLCSSDLLQSGQIGFIVVGAKVRNGGFQRGKWWVQHGLTYEMVILWDFNGDLMGISHLFVGSMGKHVEPLI